MCLRGCDSPDGATTCCTTDENGVDRCVRNKMLMKFFAAQNVFELNNQFVLRKEYKKYGHSLTFGSH